MYQLYELNHAAVQPFRAYADAVRLFYSNPLNPFSQTPWGRMVAAMAELFERTTRRYGKPSFNLPTTVVDWKTVPVAEKVAWSRPFCNLIHFERALPAGRRKKDPKLLIVAPMSGHYATLLRGTVEALMPYAEVYITDWVDARMVPVAFGTQTTGSTIRPAAFCGTVGYKPSYRDFPVTGVGDNVPAFDTLGLIARSVDDLALFRYVVMGLPHRALAEISVKGLRVGFCRSAFWERAEPATRSLLERTSEALAGAGATLRDFRMPDGEATLPEAVRKVSGFEFARAMTYERLYHGDKLSRALLDGRAADGLAAAISKRGEGVSEQMTVRTGR